MQMNMMNTRCLGHMLGSWGYADPILSVHLGTHTDTQINMPSFGGYAGLILSVHLGTHADIQMNTRCLGHMLGSFGAMLGFF